MNKKFDFEDIIEIKDGIRKKYKRVAASPEGNFQYPTGRAGLRKQNYDDVILRQFPEEVLASYCGVGNPFSLASIPKGASILDIGCGAGVDSFVAAAIVGPEGRVIGIDLIPEMVERAKKNLQKTSLPNVTIQEGSAEDLPFPDEAFDDVTSNGVFNLIPDKMKALKEVLRVLKPEGRFLLVDQILTGEIPSDTQMMVENWAKWQGGALPGKDFLAMMNEAGLGESELVGDTGFNSSPVTKGVLLRAKKSGARRVKMSSEETLSKYQEFFNSAYGPGGLDKKMKHLIALGASLAAGCDLWTRYSLAVAGEAGATDEELKETMAIAMTVGATKIRIIQENTLASLPVKKTDKPQPPAMEKSEKNGTCFTWGTK